VSAKHRVDVDWRASWPGAALPGRRHQPRYLQGVNARYRQCSEALQGTTTVGKLLKVRMGQHTAPTRTHTKPRGSTEVWAAAVPAVAALPARCTRHVLAQRPAADTRWTAGGASDWRRWHRRRVHATLHPIHVRGWDVSPSPVRGAPGVPPAQQPFTNLAVHAFPRADTTAVSKNTKKSACPRRAGKRTSSRLRRRGRRYRRPRAHRGWPSPPPSICRVDLCHAASRWERHLERGVAGMYDPPSSIGSQ